MEKLKDLLFDLFDSYENYEEIISILRNMVSEKEITEQDYNIILENYDKWLKEYEIIEIQQKIIIDL